jgi:hypothetical protein
MRRLYGEMPVQGNIQECVSVRREYRSMNDDVKGECGEMEMVNITL